MALGVVGAHVSGCVGAAMMNLAEAKDCFEDLVRRLAKKDVTPFLDWLQDNWFSEQVEEDDCDDVGDVVLDVIGADLRKVVPLDAQLPSERIVFPEVGENSDCSDRTILHVDAFLYDDATVDRMQADGTLPSEYCCDCGSRNTKPLTLTSHSMSKKTLSCIFRRYLPPLDGKMVLDVGSRAGAVLYGAFAYSTARSIIGVEMNGEWARLSGEAVLRHSMRDRVQVIHSDIRDRAHDLSVADVVVMNNVFEFFTDAALQQQLWSFIRSTVRKGALLVTVPAVDKSLSVLSTGINVTEWLSPLPINSDAGDACNDDDVHIYKVQ